MSFYNCNTEGKKKLVFIKTAQPSATASSSVGVFFEIKGINSVTIQYWSRSGSERVYCYMSNTFPPDDAFIAANYPHVDVSGSLPVTNTNPVTYTIDCKDYDYLLYVMRDSGLMTCNIISVT